MKKTILMNLLMATAITATAQDVTFKVKGTVPDTVKTVVVFVNGNQRNPIATASVSGGKFTIEGQAPKDAILGIGYPQQRGIRNMPAVNDGEPIEIMLTDESWVKGSKLNNEFSDMNNKSNLMNMAASHIKQWQELRNDKTAEGKAKLEKITKEITAMEEKCDSIKIEYVKAHSNDVTPAYIMSQLYYQFDYKELTDFINSGAAWVNHPMCAPMKKQVQALAKRQPGVMFTDLEMNDIDGKPAKLSDWVGKGNYVLVDFWASWCGPCRREMPHVVEAYNTYKEKGFDVVGVSFDSKADAWKGAVKSLGLNWHNISDLKYWQCAAAEAYGINSIPSNILVGPDGKIVASDLRGQALLDKLAEIYK